MSRKCARTHARSERRAAVGTRPQLVIFFVRIPAAKVSTGKAGEDAGMDSPWPERRRRAARKGCCTKSANGFASRGAPPLLLLLPQRGVRRVLRVGGCCRRTRCCCCCWPVEQERESDAIAGSHQHILSHGIQMNGHTQIPPAAASAGPPAPTPVTQSVCGLGGRRSSFATTSPRVVRPSAILRPDPGAYI